MITRPKSVVILLPIWGSEYISKMVEFSLPTYLAPGNLPTLAKEFPVTICLLTDSGSFEFFKQNNLYNRLSTLANVSMVNISDLVGTAPYSIVLTMAFARGMFATPGLNPQENAFLLFVSDYVFADGAFAAIVRELKNGHRALFQGNFGVVEDAIVPYLKKCIEPDGILSISPSKLLSLAREHLHPVTASRFLDQEVLHHEYPNRFFWRIPGTDGIIGRFFLMHPICLWPERNVDLIFGFTDYFLFPECVPSGKFKVLDNSLDFFLIELEPIHHESKGIALGPHTPKKLVAHLAYWTTKEHRKFPDFPVRYRGYNVDAAKENEIIQSSQIEIDNIRRQIESEPVRIGAHPYWVGAVKNRKGLRSNAVGPLIWRKALRNKIFETSPLPYVKTWQPHWNDMRPLRMLLDKKSNNSITYISSGVHSLDKALEKNKKIHKVYRWSQLEEKCRETRSIFEKIEEGHQVFCFLNTKDLNYLPVALKLIEIHPHIHFILFMLFEYEEGCESLRRQNDSVRYFLAKLALFDGRKVNIQTTSAGVKRFLTRVRVHLRNPAIVGLERRLGNGISYFLVAIEAMRNILVRLRGQSLNNCSGKRNYSYYIESYPSSSLPIIASQFTKKKNLTNSFSVEAMENTMELR